MTNTPASTPQTTRRRIILGALIGSIMLGTVVTPQVYRAYAEYHDTEIAAAAAEGSASAYAQISATQAVPDRTSVCDLLDSTDLEQRTGLQIAWYSLSRESGTDFPRQSCQIDFAQPDDDIADTIMISYAAASHPERSLVEDRRRYAASSKVDSIAMDGLPGEAVSYVEAENEKIVWRSPVGAEVTIGFISNDSTLAAKDPEGAHELLLHILEEVVPIIDEVAAGPQHPVIYFPASPPARRTS